MRDLGRAKRGLSGTDSRPGDYPLGSIQSRAAARASVEAAPCIAVMHGSDLPNFAALDDMHGPVFERLQGETVNEFKARMLRLPGRKRGGLITHYFKDRPHFPD